MHATQLRGHKCAQAYQLQGEEAQAECVCSFISMIKQCPAFRISDRQIFEVNIVISKTK